jgi:hypothetical protein
MRKAVFTILGALLIAGSTVQAATAEHHHGKKARVAPSAGSQQFRDANNSLVNQPRVITDCQYREPGNPYDERTDYAAWSAWRADGGWDSRNDCW